MLAATLEMVALDDERRMLGEVIDMGRLENQDAAARWPADIDGDVSGADLAQVRLAFGDAGRDLSADLALVLAGWGHCR
ncbi:MAG: hypothetical protein VX672_05825 [Planctomycetota bacterium]|nr:hypothetical protein [Planctomycetota bacterium]